MTEDHRKTAADRRAENRRKPTDPVYSGPERRAHERRTGFDRRAD
ncbi:MAG: hypothetical protein V4459_03950 [Pseudomonadota bacterium]